jgi:hypothetical protein
MMTLINETEHAAELVRLALDEQRTAGIVIVKSTYDIAAGQVTLSPRQRPVLFAPHDVGGVEFEPETVLGKVGVDILAVGSAAGGGDTRVSSVAMRVGDWSSHAVVFGDRVWRRSMLSWVATDPMPFAEVPVNWSTAYGGIARQNEVPIPHQGNPHGKGYVLEVDRSVEGLPLPNVEDPRDLVQRPGQQVQPFGFAPLPCSSTLRVESAVGPDGRPRGKAIFNVAQPQHRIDQVVGGERCEVHGWAGMWADVFEVPLAGFVVEVDIEDRRYEFFPRIDTVCVFPSDRQLVIVRRSTFTYSYIRGTTRATRLRHATPTCANAEGSHHGV